jgi:hypothetical protein
MIVAAVAACGAPDGETAVDGGATDVDADVGGATDAAPSAPILVEDFATGGASWPSGWTVLGGVASASVDGGRGRLVPTVTDYTLGRMGHALPAGAVDLEVTFTLAMSDPARQGVGFYVRQNGGHLRVTPEHGRGYAVFIEGFRGPQIGIWRERDGVEEPLRMVAVPALAADTTYAVRFRCRQDGAMTTLAARIWPAGGAEPSDWTITTTDATAALQGADGGVAVDAWNTATPGQGPTPAAIFVDGIVVRSAP